MRAVAAGLAAAALLLQPASAAVESVLFPEPLHVRREVHDPIAGTVVVVEEYCSGNRVATRAGARVVIADHARQELTEIDHAARTFSVTSFVEIARAQAQVEHRLSAEASLQGRALGSRASTGGRMLDVFEFVRPTPGGRQLITVSVDPRFQLAPPAVEALIGAAFPNRRGFLHDAVIRAGAGGGVPDRRAQTASAAMLAFPFEYEVVFESRGERIAFRSAVLEIGQKSVPEELVRLPPGARQVESTTVALPRFSRELDSLPPRR